MINTRPGARCNDIPSLISIDIINPLKLPIFASRNFISMKGAEFTISGGGDQRQDLEACESSSMTISRVLMNGSGSERSQ